MNRFPIRPGLIWLLSCKAYQKGMVRTAMLLKIVNHLLFKCLLPYEAELVEEVVLRHWGLGVVVHPQVRFGRNVALGHHVTIAGETWIGSPLRVVIEDDAQIFTAAIIIGNNVSGLRIGKGSRVGAGAIVNEDVADGETVVAALARPLHIVRSEKREL